MKTFCAMSRISPFLSPDMTIDSVYLPLLVKYFYQLCVSTIHSLICHGIYFHENTRQRIFSWVFSLNDTHISRNYTINHWYECMYNQLLQELVNVLDTKPDFHSAKFWLVVFQVKNVRAFAKVGKKERWFTPAQTSF